MTKEKGERPVYWEAVPRIRVAREARREERHISECHFCQTPEKLWGR